MTGAARMFKAYDFAKGSSTANIIDFQNSNTVLFKFAVQGALNFEILNVWNFRSNNFIGPGRSFDVNLKRKFEAANMANFCVRMAISSALIANANWGNPRRGASFGSRNNRIIDWPQALNVASEIQTQAIYFSFKRASSPSVFLNVQPG